jgi:hypothetical protein
MRSAAVLSMTCGCTRADHELRCVFTWVSEERGRLYAGLYDGRRAPAQKATRIRLLNPTVADEDPTARRFAMLEVD